MKILFNQWRIQKKYINWFFFLEFNQTHEKTISCEVCWHSISLVIGRQWIKCHCCPKNWSNCATTVLCTKLLWSHDWSLVTNSIPLSVQTISSTMWLHILSTSDQIIIMVRTDTLFSLDNGYLLAVHIWGTIVHLECNKSTCRDSIVKGYVGRVREC